MRSLVLITVLLAIAVSALAFNEIDSCKPGSSLKIKCNECRCGENGRYGCTRRACPEEDEKLQGDDPNAAAPANGNGDEGQTQTNGQVCTPNEVKMEDCNRCKCAANGIGWFCTRKSCPKAKREVAQKCTPGKTELDEDQCNTCTCSEDGLQKICTLMECTPYSTTDIPSIDTAPNTPGFKCTPRQSFRYKCNRCRCDSTGTLAACTFKACVD